LGDRVGIQDLENALIEEEDERRNKISSFESTWNLVEKMEIDKKHKFSSTLCI